MATPDYRPVGEDALRGRGDMRRIMHGHEGSSLGPHVAVQIHRGFASEPIIADDFSLGADPPRFSEGAPWKINRGKVAVAEKECVYVVVFVHITADNFSACIDASCRRGERTRNVDGGEVESPLLRPGFTELRPKNG